MKPREQNVLGCSFNYRFVWKFNVFLLCRLEKCNLEDFTFRTMSAQQRILLSLRRWFICAILDPLGSSKLGAYIHLISLNKISQECRSNLCSQPSMSKRVLAIRCKWISCLPQTIQRVFVHHDCLSAAGSRIRKWVSVTFQWQQYSILSKKKSKLSSYMAWNLRLKWRFGASREIWNQSTFLVYIYSKESPRCTSVGG